MKSPINYYCVCDTETGGLPNKSKKAVFDIAITEIAFVIVSNAGEIVDQDSWLIKPYSEDAEYGQIAAEVSGISKDLCEKEGIEIKEVVKLASKFLSKYKVGKNLPITVGHNFKSFDTEFVQNTFEFCGKDITKVLAPHKNNHKASVFLETACEKCEDETLYPILVNSLNYLQKIEVIDTLDLGRQIWDESANFKLGTCCSNMGVELAEAHRALPDTIATAEFFCKVLKRMKSENTSVSINNSKSTERPRIKFEM